MPRQPIPRNDAPEALVASVDALHAAGYPLVRANPDTLCHCGDRLGDHVVVLPTETNLDTLIGSALDHPVAGLLENDQRRDELPHACATLEFTFGQTFT